MSKYIGFSSLHTAIIGAQVGTRHDMKVTIRRFNGQWMVRIVER